MTRLSASILALGLVATMGAASAQSGYDPRYGDSHYGDSRYGQPTVDRYGQSHGSQYDYARVIRVDPVFDSGYGNGYRNYGTSSQRCYTRDDGYYAGNDGYRDDGYYDRDRGYRNDDYNRDGYRGSEGGRTMATVLGGVLGAVVGSQIGGGSGRYATAAVGTMVGGIAGQKIYEANQRNRYRQGSVTVCDPVPAGGDGYYSTDASVRAYDVTYEYAGRRYTTRTDYHPGDTIRVRVDVRPE
jgi:hypothetical protein